MRYYEKLHAEISAKIDGVEAPATGSVRDTDD
jgi:hypothetical protein